MSASKPKAPTLVVAGGGTGGHVLAGVAVADAWKARYGADAPVLFVGAQGGIEEKLVPRAGYPLEVLRIGALNRVSLAVRLKTACRLPLSIARSFLILHRARPQAVLGVGGYASGPLVLAARTVDLCFPWAKCRTAILEQNSVPGLTNRLLGAWVHQVFTAFPGLEGLFKGGRVRVTGNPVRPAIKPLPAAAHDPFVVFVFGGSQGAMGINTLVIDALPHLNDLKSRIRFIHQTGEKDFERVRKAHEESGIPGSRVEKFIYDMPECYAQASLLICRAGSSTLSELAAVGRASVLVPLPTAADNHQEKNARVFTDQKAAELMLQGKSTGADLARFIRAAVADPSKTDGMAREIARFYKPDSAKEIVNALSVGRDRGRDERGFSLVETMIAGIVLIGIIYAIATSLSFSTKAQQNVKVTADIDNAAEYLTLQASINCNALMAGTVVNKIVPTVQATWSPVQFGVTVPPMPSGLTLKPVVIRTLSATGTPNNYITQLELTFVKNAATSIGAPTTMRTVPMTVVINPGTNQIVSCTGSGNGLVQRQQACADVGGTWNAASTPPCALPIPPPPVIPPAVTGTYLCNCTYQGDGTYNPYNNTKTCPGNQVMHMTGNAVNGGNWVPVITCCDICLSH